MVCVRGRRDSKVQSVAGFVGPREARGDEDNQALLVVVVGAAEGVAVLAREASAMGFAADLAGTAKAKVPRLSVAWMKFAVVRDSAE